MQAGLGEAGQVWIHFDAGPPELIWQNPADFNSAGVEISQSFTAPAGATEMEFSYMVVMDRGWLAYAEPELQWLRPEYTITRKTYSLGGQTIAARISGDPVSGNNGLFYIHTDHLGSTSVMSYGQGHGGDAGNKVAGSAAHYLPFGGWRVEPSHDLTDQAFTGQKHNMDIGLYYYNARYYLPGAGRFLSADPIVPDPGNPQQYNRYTYVLNNPLRFTDPSGHCAGDPGQPGECYGNTLATSYSYKRRTLAVTVQILVDNSLSHGVVINSNTILTHNHFDVAGIENLGEATIHVYDAWGNDLCLDCSLASVGEFQVDDGDVLDLTRLVFADNVFFDHIFLPTQIERNASDLRGREIGVVSYRTGNTPSGYQSEVVWTTVANTAYVVKNRNPYVPSANHAVVSGLEVNHAVPRGASGGASVMIVGSELTLVGINSSRAGTGNTGFVAFAY